MTTEGIMDLLEARKAVISGKHFVLTSGKHARAYVNMPDALKDSETGLQIASGMANLVFSLGFDAVTGPTHVGDKIAYDLGLALALKGRNVQRFYAQEGGEGDTRSFPRQTGSVADMRVLVVDDVLTTGGTIDETIEAVGKDGGITVAVAVACNRSEFRGGFKGLPLLELMYVPLESWEFNECPVCVERVPIYTAVGHGQDFLDRYGTDPTNWPTNKTVIL